MLRMIYPSALGGLAVLVIILVAVFVLGQFGANFGEALYVSVSGVLIFSHALTSWRLR